MEYEKKYKEALKWVQKLYPSFEDWVKEDAEHYFPELTKDKNEKIKKEIIDFLELPHHQFVGKRNHEKWIDWLEKQKEFVSADFDDVWKTADCDELIAPLEKYFKDAIKKMCHAWYDKGIELERRNWLEKQGKTLDADKVIEWLKTKVYDDSTYGMAMIEQFKKDFEI